MTKKAHITTIPGHALGDRVLGLCGKEWTVKELWADLPRNKPICRDCVDIILEAATQADKVLQRMRGAMIPFVRRTDDLVGVLADQSLLLDMFADANETFIKAQAAMMEDAEAERRAATSCTCTWQDRETRVGDPDCPIHGATEPGADVDVPVAPDQQV